MVDMCDYAEVSEARNGDCLDAALEVGHGLGSLRVPWDACGEGTRGEGKLGILGSEGARKPEELKWASLHLWIGCLELRSLGQKIKYRRWSFSRRFAVARSSL